MEDTLIWWLNTSRNLELILRTANPIEIMISNVNHHALPNPKYGESQTMDMSEEDIMEVLMNRL